jgi:hypothetical protein
MRRSIPLLIVVLAVQLGLAGLLAMRRNPLASIPPQSPLIGAAAQSADRLVLEAGPGAAAATRVEIARRNGQWVLPGYFNAPADKFKVEDLLSELADLRHGLPIATSQAALERFKLADDDFERRLTLSQGAHALGTLYFGSATGARRSDARTAADHAVYSVDLATYELPTQLSAWFANDLLESQPEQLSGVDITMPQGMLHLVHQGTPKPAWSVTDLPAGRHLDEAKAETLASTIGDLRLQGVLGTSAQPAWQQEHPLLTLTLHPMQHSAQSWVVSQPVGASYYVLKASSQPWYFSLDATTGMQLLDAATPSVLLAEPAAAGRSPAAARSAPTRGRTLIIHHLPARARTDGSAGSSAPVAH